MRTEDDLRTALTALERHAPDAARVLPGTERRRSGRGLRSPRTIRLLSGIATTAALAGVVTALTLPGGTHKAIPNGGVAPSAPITKTTLEAKLLAALSSNSDIVYETGWTTNTGVAPITQKFWFYPWLPTAGQRVRTRELTDSTDGKVHTDVGTTYVMPAPSSKSCGLPGWHTAQGDYIFVDYAAKTWFDNKHDTLLIGPPRSPAELIKDTGEHWTISHTTLDGRPALELTTKGTAGDNSWDTSLWFDAGTYLPLREVTSFGPKNIRTSATFSYQYLPPTAANLAQLMPPIPSGFRQVHAEQVPASGPCIPPAKGIIEITPTNPRATLTLAPSPAGPAKLLIGRIGAARRAVPDLGHQRSRD